MNPGLFYKGFLKDMPLFCAYPPCSKPYAPDGTDYCSARCGEDHDTVQRGGTPLPEHERCLGEACILTDFHGRRRTWHVARCPRYVPHPEDVSHPLENL